MNTRSRSSAAGQAKKEEPKSSKPVKKEVVVVSSDEDEVVDIVENDEDEVDEDDDDEDYDEPEYKPKSAAARKKQQPKSSRKEPRATKPRSARKVAEPKAKAEPKLVATTKKEPKAEPKETLEEKDEEDEGAGKDNQGFYYELNEKEMKEVNHAFDMNHSDNGDELLNADALRTAIRSLGFEPRGDEIQKLLKKFGKKGKVNREGFHKIMTHKIGSTPGLTNDNNAKDEISRVFNLLDLDKTGFITVDNLRTIAKELNEELDDDELLEMIVEADTDGDKKIDKEDFQRIMKKTNLY